jgi:hypothetical protein
MQSAGPSSEKKRKPQLKKRSGLPRSNRYYLGRKYERAKKQGERTDLTSGQNDQKSTSAERIADEHGTTEKTEGFKGNQWTENAVRQNDGNHTAQKIAQEHGTSPQTEDQASQD